MKRTITLALLLACHFARATNWTNYPVETAPTPDETFLVGSAASATNHQLASSNLLAWTKTNALNVGQWQVWTNPLNNSLAVSNTVFHTTQLVMLTNGATDFQHNMLTNVGVLNLTNSANAGDINLYYGAGFGFKMAPSKWGVGGIQFENSTSGGFVLANAGNGATIQIQGAGTENILFTGNSFDMQPGGTFESAISLDGGQITTDGSGDMTFNSTTPFSLSDAGSAPGNPSSPVGWIQINVNGTTSYIPYYQ